MLMKTQMSGIGCETSWAEWGPLGPAELKGVDMGLVVVTPSPNIRLKFSLIKVHFDLQKYSWFECHFVKIKYSLSFYHTEKTHICFGPTGKLWTSTRHRQPRWIYERFKGAHRVQGHSRRTQHFMSKASRLLKHLQFSPKCHKIEQINNL